MLILRLHKDTSIVFKDRATKDRLGQIVLADKSPLDYVDLAVDAKQDFVIHRERLSRNIDRIVESTEMVL